MNLSLSLIIKKDNERCGIFKKMENKSVTVTDIIIEMEYLNFGYY